MFSVADVSPHSNLKNDLFNFAQDFTYSLHSQRQLYYGEWIKSWNLQNIMEVPVCIQTSKSLILVIVGFIFVLYVPI